MQTSRYFLGCGVSGILALLLLPAAAGPAAGPAGADSSRAASPAARDALEGARPRVALLKVNSSGGRRYGCGVLAAPMRVLTSAHLVPADARVSVGLNGVSYPA